MNYTFIDNITPAGESSPFNTKDFTCMTLFGSVAGASTLTIQYSADGRKFYDSGDKIVMAGAGEFGQFFDLRADWIRIKASGAVATTAIGAFGPAA